MIKIAIAFTFCAATFGVSAQKTIGNVEIRDLDNRPVMSADIILDGSPTLIVFWATWCSHTKDGLSTINDDYLEDWRDDYNLKVVAVSVDDSRNLNKVRPYVNGQGWEFDVYTDVNSDFKRIMNVNNAPFFMLLDKEGTVVWSHNSYAPGDEETIEEQLQELNQ
jgi:cytochrome c biogenesis protein CcmG, thiol:disulfide interchange protein DsbE